LAWFARWRNEPLSSTTPHFFPPKEKTVNAKKEKEGDFFRVSKNAAPSFPKKRPAKLENPIPFNPHPSDVWLDQTTGFPT
jgi:hypothetical protein